MESASETTIIEDNQLHSAADTNRYRAGGTNLILLMAEARDTGTRFIDFLSLVNVPNLLLVMCNDRLLVVV